MVLVDVTVTENSRQLEEKPPNKEAQISYTVTLRFFLLAHKKIKHKEIHSHPNDLLRFCGFKVASQDRHCHRFEHYYCFYVFLIVLVIIIVRIVVVSVVEVVGVMKTFVAKNLHDLHRDML